MSFPVWIAILVRLTGETHAMSTCVVDWLCAVSGFAGLLILISTLILNVEILMIHVQASRAWDARLLCLAMKRSSVWALCSDWALR